MDINGVPGRLTHRTTREDQKRLWFKQRWISETRAIKGYGTNAVLRVECRFDDELGNGHNTFAITAEVTKQVNKAGTGLPPRYRAEPIAAGCLHDDIAAVFPELAYLIPWHLTSSDGPMHYIANTVYLAGNRDHNGLRKGETRQLTTRDGELRWELVAVNSLGISISTTPTGLKYQGSETVPLFILEQHATGDIPPATPKLEWRRALKIGEGKKRELDAARRTANWPEATDEELSVEPDQLKQALEERAPALMVRFKADMIRSGFVWSPEDMK